MIYTCMDIETTGLNAAVDDLLSVGWLRFNEDFKVLSNGVLYFYQPDFKVEKYPACDIHKLTRDFLREYEGDFATNYKKLFTLFHRSNMIGKNSNGFDIPFIKEFLLRHCRKAYNDLQPEVLKTFDVQVYVAPIYQKRNNTTKKGTLTQYAQMYGITDDNIREVMNNLPTKVSENQHYHGALWDAVVTYLVMKAYCEETGLKI